VVILRHNTERSLGGRSACMSCRHQLSWHELVPVFSFLALGGRCKNCKTKISIQYPLVELTTGLVFALLFLKFEPVLLLATFSFIVTYAYYAVLFSLLIVVSVYDFRHKIIPDVFAFCFGVLAFAGMFLFSNYGISPHIPGIWDLLAGVLVAFPFAAIWFLSRGTWMGLGDAKLTLGLGWMLGLARALSGVVIAFWAGALIGIILIAFTKKYKIKSEIPFAPFLVIGAIFAFLFELHLFPFF